MAIPKFDEKELDAAGEIPATPFRPAVKRYNYPVSPRDAFLSLYNQKKAYWQISGIESRMFTPHIFADNVARALVSESRPFNPFEQGGGLDMFGVKWVFVPVVGGSMEDPNEEPWMDDANDWKDIIHFPDLETWDWEGCAAENNGTYLTPDLCNYVWIQNGFFERLISFMGFEDASVAMIDPDQEDAVKELMFALADLYIDIIDHFVKYFDNINGFYIHDDWGSSKDTFIAPDRIAEIVVPAMRRVTDHLHSIGLYADFHSCGCNYKQVPNMIAAGWDVWVPQSSVNDVDKIYQEFGDKLLIGIPVQFDPETTSEEEQRQIARDYAKKYCHPDKPSLFNGVESAMCMTPAFYEELYKCSRILYSGGSID